MLQVLAIDPGKASGVALLDYDKADGAVTIVHTDELDEYATGDYINAVITDARARQAPLVVVCEDFRVTQRTTANTRADWSLHLIGATRWLCHAHGIGAPVLQTAGAAKGMFPEDNKKLRAVGLWHRGGEGHARDALRHGATYLIQRQGWKPDGLLAS